MTFECRDVIQGPDEGPLGLRGDGIRLWETRDSEIRNNQVIGCRDLVVWYSSRNKLIGNTVVRGREHSRSRPLRHALHVQPW